MARDLFARLRNWGDWLNYEASIRPDALRCRGIESQYLPDAGEVSYPGETYVTPDVSDAHAMQVMVDRLQLMQQYALAIRYGGAPAVFRMRRVGEHAMQRQADSAEEELREMLRLSA